MHESYHTIDEIEYFYKKSQSQSYTRRVQNMIKAQGKWEQLDAAFTVIGAFAFIIMLWLFLPTIITP